MTPIRRPNLLSDSLHIGSITEKAHRSYREMASAVIVGLIWEAVGALGFLIFRHFDRHGRQKCRHVRQVRLI